MKGDLRVALGDSNEQDVKDRRAHPRDTVLYGGRVSFGVNEYPCTVLNISAGGAQIRAQGVNVEALTVVTLHIDRFGAFHARVVWQRAGKLGLQFLEDAVIVTKRIIAAGSG